MNYSGTKLQALVARKRNLLLYTLCNRAKCPKKHVWTLSLLGVTQFFNNRAYKQRYILNVCRIASLSH